MSEGASDAEYIERFHEVYPAVSRPPSLASYAAPVRYDRLYMGQGLLKRLKSVTNDHGGIAWGLSSRMRSLNDMYRATGDPKYLKANLPRELSSLILDATGFVI